MTRRRFLYLCGAGAGGILGLWVFGFLLFVARVASYVEPPIDDALQVTDAIVVLTGGSERVQAGLDLLRAGKGKKLLISGVYPGVGLARILGTDAMPADLRDCCVVLGHEADNTLGNAEETRTFMRGHGFSSLRLVTAHYHMPRSLFFLRHEMPEIRIVPHPVSPDVVSLGGWWRSPGTARLLTGEYNKYLYARLRAALGVL